MNIIDASVVLNLHREGVFLKRTLRSIDLAVAYARERGLRIELVAVLDRADQLTRQVLAEHTQSAFNQTTILEVDNGSLGLSRNSGVGASSGEYILMADGDDLVSENFIFDTILLAKQGVHDCLYFPEFLLAFSASYHVGIYRPLREVTPLAFISSHPYTSRVCAHRSVFERFKYEDLRLSRGYAYEDWHFNANAVAHGLDVKVVPDTILFYRQRRNSLLHQANAQSSRQISPSELFKPAKWLSECKPFISIANKREEMGHLTTKADLSCLDRIPIQKYIRQANAIEPEIHLELFKGSPIYANTQESMRMGIAYYNICSLLKELTFNDVFLFPFLARGGAEKYFLELLHSLHRLYPDRSTLVLLGEEYTGASWRDKLPPNVIDVPLKSLCRKLSDFEIGVLSLKLVEASCKNARIHIRQSAFGDNFLRNFGHLFPNQDLIYYRFSDSVELEDSHPIVKHSPLGLISDRIEHLTHIVTDNQNIINQDADRLGIFAEKWKLLPAPISITRSNRRITQNQLKNVLWASRIDREKRPQIVAKVAKILNSKKSEIRIKAHGESVFKELTESVMSGSSNLSYEGPYDGFASIEVQSFGIFLYTSWYDGVPNVLLEAMSSGLVVVAPDVGGISEIVQNGNTGLLIPSLPDENEMAKLYAEAILQLSENEDLANSLADGAIELLRGRNSYKKYDETITLLFHEKDRVHG